MPTSNHDSQTISPQIPEEHELTIRDLYPDMPEEELGEAEENLTAYADFVMRMDQRLRAQLEEQSQLTAQGKSDTTEERSKQ